MKWLAVFCIAVASGLGPAGAGDKPLPTPRPKQTTPSLDPSSFREVAGSDFQSAAVTSAPSACRLRLEKTATLRPIPRLIGPGACGGEDMVELGAVLLDKGRRVEIKPAPVLRCEMAEQLTLWVRDDVAPRVVRGGLTLASVETYDDYDCRGRNRIAGAKLSEHGKGNAVDIRSLTFADKKTALLTDKTVAKDLRTDLRASACARFTTVLGPGSDGYHEEHIHLDLAQRRGNFRMCQWNVLEPPPPPKPAEVAIVDDKADDRAAAKPEGEAMPAEADDDVEDTTDKPAQPSPVVIAAADVPLPRPRPATRTRKSRGGIHLPFNLLR